MAEKLNNGFARYVIGVLVAMLCASSGWFVSSHCQADDVQTVAIYEIKLSLVSIAEQFKALEVDRNRRWDLHDQLMAQLVARLDSLDHRINPPQVRTP